MVFVAMNVCPFTTNYLEFLSEVTLTAGFAFQFQVIFMSNHRCSLSSHWLEIFSCMGGALEFSF
jgi:hypothetical protein